MLRVCLVVVLIACVFADHDNSHLKRNLKAKKQYEPLWGTVTLANGPNFWSGRVEVFFDGTWGTVCDDSWDTLDAQVVCRQLGMLGGEAHDYAEFGEGSGLIHLDNVECDGSESSISDCDSNVWGDENCSHYEDASVTCEPEGAIRLADGPSPSEGRVEIYHNGEWGTVCDDHWTSQNANVVCRQLGYSEGIPLEDNEYGDGSGSIFMDEVNCDGYEDSLISCGHNGWGNHDCSHYEDAGVICG